MHLVAFPRENGSNVRFRKAEQRSQHTIRYALYIKLAGVTVRWRTFFVRIPFSASSAGANVRRAALLLQRAARSFAAGK